MRPILFTWGRLRVPSYTALLYLGMLSGTFAAHVLASDVGLDPTRVVLATMVLLVPALIGARLLFVASHWPRYRADRTRIWHRAEGGASLYGGLLLAIPISWPLLLVLGLPVATFWDVSVFTMLIGLVWTRVGCLLNGCCGGRATTGRFSMHLPDARGVWARRVPVQPLEVALALALLAVATVMRRREPFAGALFLQILIAYGVARLLLDSWRQHDASARGARATRICAGLSVVLPFVALVAAWK